MAETIGYMLTWTTYGTWLQGELKGFVKNGKARGDNVALRKSNIRNLKGTVKRRSGGGRHAAKAEVRIMSYEL